MSKKLFAMGLPTILMVLTFVAFVTCRVVSETGPQLKLVNIIFRHGDRAPDAAELYPRDPHRNFTYYPMGIGGLTNGGKMREYRLGQLFRELYGDFLGPIYEPLTLEARSTDYDRTKMSLQLVLAGLLPPTPVQQWNEDLSWQPIPTIYKASHADNLMIPELCPKYLAELARVRSSPEVQSVMESHSALMEFLEEHTGKPMKTATDPFDLYHTFVAEQAMNLSIPEWAEGMYPDGELSDLANFEYKIMSYNEKLRRLNGGMMVRKLSEDMIAFQNGTLPPSRKMYLYSGHEMNVASLLNALGVYTPHIPTYSSAVIVELWQQRNDFFVKVLYHTGIPSSTTVKTIPGCEELCPFSTFLELMKPVTPSDTDIICVKKDTTPPQGILSLSQLEPVT